MKHPETFSRKFRIIAEILLACTALSLALLISYWFGRFAAAKGEFANTSPDFVLSFLPVVDLRFLFVWGFAAFLVFMIAAGLWSEFQRSAYIIWMYALLIFVRSFFIVLTPMKSPNGALWVAGDPLYDSIGKYFTFQNDLFFSAHTALPFLGYLVFRTQWMRWVLLGFSILLATTVLLCRLHYSIDVAAAYFITYAVYKGEIRWFRWRYRAWRRKWIVNASWPFDYKMQKRANPR